MNDAVRMVLGTLGIVGFVGTGLFVAWGPTVGSSALGVLALCVALLVLGLVAGPSDDRPRRPKR